MTWIKQNKLLFIGIVVVVAGAIWFGLTRNSAPSASLITTVDAAGSPTQESTEQELVAILLTLRAVTLSGTIFQDPAFINLRDFGTTIVAEPVGRQNPFAPLGARAPAASQAGPSGVQR